MVGEAACRAVTATELTGSQVQRIAPKHVQLPTMLNVAAKVSSSWPHDWDFISTDAQGVQRAIVGSTLRRRAGIVTVRRRAGSESLREELVEELIVAKRRSCEVRLASKPGHHLLLDDEGLAG